jgi:hypothetical protein
MFTLSYIHYFGFQLGLKLRLHLRFVIAKNTIEVTEAVFTLAPWVLQPIVFVLAQLKEPR